jgi:hypothetical protein
MFFTKDTQEKLSIPGKKFGSYSPLLDIIIVFYYMHYPVNPIFEGYLITLSSSILIYYLSIYYASSSDIHLI